MILTPISTDEIQISPEDGEIIFSNIEVNDVIKNIIIK